MDQQQRPVGTARSGAGAGASGSVAGGGASVASSGILGGGSLFRRGHSVGMLSPRLGGARAATPVPQHPSLSFSSFELLLATLAATSQYTRRAAATALAAAAGGGAGAGAEAVALAGGGSGGGADALLSLQSLALQLGTLLRRMDTSEGRERVMARPRAPPLPARFAVGAL